MGLTWTEIHMFEIGLGDSLSRKKVDWKVFWEVQPKYINELMGELHYYQMGIFIPRAILISIIIVLINKLLS